MMFCSKLELIKNSAIKENISLENKTVLGILLEKERKGNMISCRIIKVKGILKIPELTNQREKIIDRCKSCMQDLL